MSLVRLAVPLFLLALFLWKARRSPIFLLGIPFLQVMGASVFLERLRVLDMGARYGLQVPIMVSLVGAWIVSLALPSNDDDLYRGPQSRPTIAVLPEELPLLLIALIALGQVLVRFAMTRDIGSAVGGPLGFLSMILGYFLVRDIVSRATPREIVGFLGLVVLANTVAAALYVLHQGLHLHVYQTVEYLTVLFRGQIITRSFWIAPQLSLLALGYVLARREWRGVWLGVLIITVLAAWVTYTRGLVVAVLIAATIGLVAHELRSPNITRFARRLVGILAACTLVVCIVLVAMPVNARYFGQRLQEVFKPVSGGDVATWHLRTSRFVSIERTVAQSDLLFGVGFPSPAPPEAQNAYRWSADMAWIAVVYRFGLAGLALFGLMFAGFGVRAYRLFRTRSGESSYLELVYLIALVLTFVLSFREWTFMLPLVFPMGLWLFAFMSAEAMRPDPSNGPTEWPSVAEPTDAPALTR